MTQSKLLSSQRKKTKKLVSSKVLASLTLHIDFNLDDEDDIQDEAELVESLLEEFDDM
jgi:hypothetical protein